MTRRAGHGVAGALLVPLLVAGAGGCGVGGNGKFRDIKDARVPTIAPTTTTTTLPPTTTPPTTLPVATSAASTTTSTTRAPTTIATVEERLFYISGTKLKADIRRVPGVLSIQPLLTDLGADPTDKSLRTAVRSAYWGETSATEGGLAVIELRPAFSALSDSEAQLALAQIVYTVLSNIAGVGQVQFTRDDRPFSVPRSNGTQTNGEPVTKLDYPDFVASS